MGVREQQKQATRARVMDAARDLFDHVGYEETTIRAIAEKAGVSVGSVFTTFSSKADILSQVIAERTAALTAELERVTGSVVVNTRDRDTGETALRNLRYWRERGEAPATLDIELAIETLVALYGFNYLRVAEGAGSADLTAVMDRQLRLLFEGLQPRAGVNPAL